MNITIKQVREQECETTDLPLSVLYAWQKALDVPVAELLAEVGDSLVSPILERSQLIRLRRPCWQFRGRPGRSRSGEWQRRCIINSWRLCLNWRMSFPGAPWANSADSASWAWPLSDAWRTRYSLVAANGVKSGAETSVKRLGELVATVHRAATHVSGTRRVPSAVWKTCKQRHRACAGYFWAVNGYELVRKPTQHKIMVGERCRRTRRFRKADR